MIGLVNLITSLDGDDRKRYRLVRSRDQAFREIATLFSPVKFFSESRH